MLILLVLNRLRNHAQLNSLICLGKGKAFEIATPTPRFRLSSCQGWYSASYGQGLTAPLDV
jgi:hypothetical protein